MCPISWTSFIYLISNNFSQRLGREEGAASKAWTAFSLPLAGCMSAVPDEQYRPFIHCLFSGMYGGHVNTHTPLVCLQSLRTHETYRPHKVNLSACTHTHSGRLSSCLKLVGCLGWGGLVDIPLPVFVRLLLHRGRTLGCCKTAGRKTWH